MPSELVIRLSTNSGPVDLPATLLATGDAVAAAPAPTDRPAVLLTGDRDYLVALHPPLADGVVRALTEQTGQAVHITFPGRKPVRRRLAEVRGLSVATPSGGIALDLTAGRPGARPLWLRPDGTFSANPGEASAASPLGAEPSRAVNLAADPDLAEHAALITAARWISSRRTTTFERQ